MSDFIINRIFLKNVQNFIFITPTTLSCSSCGKCGNRYFCIFPVFIIVWSMWITSHHLIQFFCLILLCEPAKVVDDFQFLFASEIMIVTLQAYVCMTTVCTKEINYFCSIQFIVPTFQQLLWDLQKNVQQGYLGRFLPISHN